MSKRGWTEEDIHETIDQPHKTARATDRRGYTDGSGEPATAYFDKGDTYVVVNDHTRSVVQVSNKNHPNWQIPDDFVYDAE